MRPEKYVKAVDLLVIIMSYSQAKMAKKIDGNGLVL
jgi:hypothetical protein